jgi:hypothetical protein
MLCDTGCFNYSKPAKALGAIYHGEPQGLSMKKHGAFYIGKNEAMNVVRAYRNAVNAIKEPYFIQLEDDVFTIKRIKGPLKGAINGIAVDKSIVGWAVKYVHSKVPEKDRVTHPMYLGGFGGCVYETAYWRRILNLPDIEKEIEELFEGLEEDYGVDYIMSSLLWRYGGTMYNWPGHAELFRDTTFEAILQGKIDVLHGWKANYNVKDDGLSKEEKDMLGDYAKGMDAMVY